MLLSRHQAGQNDDIKIGNRCLENVAQFRYLGTNITNQSQIQEEIQRRLNLGRLRVLRRIFGLKRDEVIGGWRKLHNEELHNLYSSPSVITMIKSRRMRWALHVAQMGEKRNTVYIGYWWESQKGRDHYEYKDKGGWVILKWILEIGSGGMD
jgi:hypothetical protein